MMWFFCVLNDCKIVWNVRWTKPLKDFNWLNQFIYGNYFFFSYLIFFYFDSFELHRLIRCLIYIYFGLCQQWTIDCTNFKDKADEINIWYDIEFVVNIIWCSIFAYLSNSSKKLVFLVDIMGLWCQCIGKWLM